MQGGKSSVPFSYRIVAKRVDVTGERLKRVAPDVMNAVRAQASARRTAPRPMGPVNPATPNGAPSGGQTVPGNPITLPGLPRTP